jgi:hypothetical protein
MRVSSGADPLLDRAPAEDAGSDTARWYTFQYGCALRHCMDMVRPGSGLAWVLCEWHTDFALGWTDGARTIVSVKHREADSGVWTVSRLFSDGGLSTLLDRWNRCGRPQESRWVTNGGLDVECRRIQNACASSDAASLREMVIHLSGRFRGDDSNFDHDTIENFLSGLRIDSDVPPARYLRAVDAENFVQPALIELNLDPSTASNVYDAVLRLVRSAAESCGSTPQDWLLSSIGGLDSDETLRVERSRRMIYPDQVLSTVRQVAEPITAVLPPPTRETTRLVRKLKAGDIVPTITAAARRTRRSWTEYERGFSPPLPGDADGIDLADLRARVVSEAADAQLRARPGGTPYGDRMLSDLRGRVALLARDLPGARQLDSHVLMGLVYDLTGRCEIWWSEEFDLDSNTQGDGR